MKKLSLILLLVAATLVMNSCNALENESTSSSVLLLNSIMGKDETGGESTTIFSDVAVATTDADGNTVYSYFNDSATASCTAMVLDPAADDGDSSFYQAVIVDQIDVEYSRTDGLAGDGIYVPYRFSQKTNVLIQIKEKVEIPFVIVQHNAKTEMPLIQLVSGAEKVLKLEAKVTIHSKDVGGHRLKNVVGYVSVWCANFADQG